MSRYHSGRKRREFNKLNARYVSSNYLKKLKRALSYTKDKHDVTFNECMFLLKFYEYEFFTLRHAAKALEQNEKKLYERVFTPLRRKGLLDRHYDKTDMTMLDAMFEEKNNYRVRYALTQRARILVQQFYRNIEM